MATPKDVLDLIKSLGKELELYEDTVYSTDEKKGIRTFEEQTAELYRDLKKDGYITMKISEWERERDRRIARFSKITGNVSNVLLKTKEFSAEEQWYILLSVYCWWCETAKNILVQVAKRIFRSLNNRKWKGFLMLGRFIDIMNEYRKGKYSSLFLDIDVELRNSFIHGNIDFPNNEVLYYDSKGKERRIPLQDFLSMFKKLPPLCAYLSAYRLKPFLPEIKEYAKKEGFMK